METVIYPSNYPTIGYGLYCRYWRYFDLTKNPPKAIVTTYKNKEQLLVDIDRWYSVYNAPIGTLKPIRLHPRLRQLSLHTFTWTIIAEENLCKLAKCLVTQLRINLANKEYKEVPGLELALWEISQIAHYREESNEQDRREEEKESTLSTIG